MPVRRIGYWLAVLVAAAVTATGCVLAYAGFQDDRHPESVVRAYFAALARDDAPAALALGTVPPGSHAFLTSAVLREQLAIAPVSDVRIVGVDGAGSSRTVRYSFALHFAGGSRTVIGQVGVQQHGGSWRLLRTAVTVRLEALGATSRFTIAGTALPDVRVSLFPGAVPVQPDTPHLRPLASGVATFGGDAVVNIGVAVSAAGRSDVLAALAVQLHACFPPGAASGAQCPLPPDPRIVPASFRGTLRTAGIARLHCVVSTSASGSILVRGSLQVDGSYARLDGNNVAHTVHGVVGVYVRATTPAVGAPRLQFEGDAG